MFKLKQINMFIYKHCTNNYNGCYWFEWFILNNQPGLLGEKPILFVT